MIGRTTKRRRFGNQEVFCFLRGIFLLLLHGLLSYLGTNFYTTILGMDMICLECCVDKMVGKAIG